MASSHFFSPTSMKKLTNSDLEYYDKMNEINEQRIGQFRKSTSELPTSSC